MIEINVSYYWFALSVVLLLLEVTGVNGIGLLFGGVAAGIVGVLVETMVISQSAITIQWSVWFFITALVAIGLYKPIQKWRTNPDSKDNFSNMIGNTAKVATGGLMLGKPGKVYWSGTLMNAAIAEGASQEAFFEGDIVQIADVRGNQLLVVPTQNAKTT
jgi:membrane protein implicated in regulation of membrane protease activity